LAPCPPLLPPPLLFLPVLQILPLRIWPLITPRLPLCSGASPLSSNVPCSPFAPSFLPLVFLTVPPFAPVYSTAGSPVRPCRTQAQSPNPPTAPKRSQLTPARPLSAWSLKETPPDRSPPSLWESHWPVFGGPSWQRQWVYFNLYTRCPRPEVMGTGPATRVTPWLRDPRQTPRSFPVQGQTLSEAGSAATAGEGGRKVPAQTQEPREYPATPAGPGMPPQVPMRVDYLAQPPSPGKEVRTSHPRALVYFVLVNPIINLQKPTQSVIT
jgi:hypothetical protein